VNKKQGESITFFFVRKFIYFALFKKLLSLSLKELHLRNNAIEKEQTLKRQKQEK